MCGRYYINDETAREIEKLVKNAEENIRNIKKGEVYPDAGAMILKAAKRELQLAESRWGYPKFNQKGVIFNARSETALDKKMFSASLKERRAVIPAACFYEWNSQKQKIKFYTEEPVLYMAGFWSVFKNEDRFVILTTAANDSMAEVHNRMPVILKAAEIEDWIFDEERYMQILRRVPERLKKCELE